MLASVVIAHCRHIPNVPVHANLSDPHLTRPPQKGTAICGVAISPPLVERSKQPAGDDDAIQDVGALPVGSPCVTFCGAMFIGVRQ